MCPHFLCNEIEVTVYRIQQSKDRRQHISHSVTPHLGCPLRVMPRLTTLSQTYCFRLSQAKKTEGKFPQIEVKEPGTELAPELGFLCQSTLAAVETPLPGDLHNRTFFSHSAGVPRSEIRVSDRLLSQGSSLSLVGGHLLSSYSLCECLCLNPLFKKKNTLLIYFIFGCAGSSLQRAGFLWLWGVGTTLPSNAQALGCTGFSSCTTRVQ